MFCLNRIARAESQPPGLPSFGTQENGLGETVRSGMSLRTNKRIRGAKKRVKSYTRVVVSQKYSIMFNNAREEVPKTSVILNILMGKPAFREPHRESGNECLIWFPGLEFSLIFDVTAVLGTSLKTGIKNSFPTYIGPLFRQKRSPNLNVLLFARIVSGDLARQQATRLWAFIFPKHRQICLFRAPPEVPAPS